MYQDTCLDTCPNKYYAEIVSNVCLDCPAQCSLCTSPTVCQDCITDFTLANEWCYCTSGTYLIKNTADCVATCLV